MEEINKCIIKDGIVECPIIDLKDKVLTKKSIAKDSHNGNGTNHNGYAYENSYEYPNGTPRIWISRNSDHDKAIEEAVEKVGGMCKYVVPNEITLIKMNLMGGNPNDESTYTNPDVVKKVVEMVEDCGGRPVVADSSMIWVDFDYMADKTDFLNYAKENNITLVNLEDFPRVKFDFGADSIIGKTDISWLVAQAKKYGSLINLPAMKTHLFSGITVGVKNLYGLLPSADKAKYHARGINNVIVDNAGAMSPDLTIVDGTRGCENFGPLWCEKIPDYNVIIASPDTFCADKIVARDFVGYDPNDLDFLSQASRENKGDIKCEVHPDNKFDSHPKDGKWKKPHPNAVRFVNNVTDFAFMFPNMVPIFDVLADFFLGDLAYNKWTNKHLMRPLWNFVNMISEKALYHSDSHIGKWLNMNPNKKYRLREDILEYPLEE
jgi:uncharacterized protein (DUF362 family)